MGYGREHFRQHRRDRRRRGTAQARWAARAPFRPERGLRPDAGPAGAGLAPTDEAPRRRSLERIAAEPWVDSVAERRQGGAAAARRRLDRGDAASRLEAGDGVDGANADLAAGSRYAVYFWGANTTKALHIGHLRNLAVGNAIGAALEQAGARVEHRSLICDVGRSMGEAMAGVVARAAATSRSGPTATRRATTSSAPVTPTTSPPGAPTAAGDADDGAEDSVARESSMYNDKADELMMRVLRRRPGGAGTVVEDARLGDLRPAQDAVAGSASPSTR